MALKSIFQRFSRQIAVSENRSLSFRRSVSFILASGVLAFLMLDTSNAEGRVRMEIPRLDQVSVRWTSSLVSELIREQKNARVETVNKEYIGEYSVSQYAGNVEIEDTYDVRTTLNTDRGALFAVFDGHSGGAASSFLAKEFFTYLEYYKQQYNFPELLNPRTFIDADSHFLYYWTTLKHSYINALAGSCAVVAHIKGDIIRTATVGDCRAVVGRKCIQLFEDGGGKRAPDSLTSFVTVDGPRSVCKVSTVGPTVPIDGDTTSPKLVHHVLPNPTNVTNGTKEALLAVQSPTHDAIELSVVHQIDINPYERERLLSEHPQEVDIIARNRVKGSLQPTRAFGDGAYKSDSLYRAKLELRNRARANPNTWHPPYVTAEPDITEYRLQPGDEFLVLSSDGLYNDLTPQDVVTFVGEFLHSTTLQKRYRNNCASYLIERALVAASQQEIGRQDLSTALSWIFALPKSIRRYIHDDITVQVIRFNHQATEVDRTSKCFPVDPPSTLQSIVGSIPNATASDTAPRARL
uniref:[Pyruvate dehydrogenase [acetyl-transferring]]-phosphatase 1, mitochondrial n=3 Tax=Lygus hesperus TaxID=30085 RepID=A0A0A9Z470_LYGHE